MGESRLQQPAAAEETALVGRGAELGVLWESFEETRHSRGGVHLVLGAPGIGKTSLVTAFGERAAAENALVIWSRAWGGVAPEYWPWVQIVRGLCNDVNGATLGIQLGHGAYELLRLAPELAERLPPRAVDRDAAPPAHRVALFDALACLLRWRSLERPIVIVLDELDGADSGSIAALDFVSRMIGDAAVLIVATMREPAARSPQDHPALGRIVGASRRLVLGGLTRAEVGALVQSTAGVAASEALVERVHLESEGNPRFLQEVMASLATGEIEALGVGEVSGPSFDSRRMVEALLRAVELGEPRLAAVARHLLDEPGAVVDAELRFRDDALRIVLRVKAGGRRLEEGDDRPAGEEASEEDRRAGAWGAAPNRRQLVVAAELAEGARAGALADALDGALSRRQVAERLGVSPQAVSERLKARRLVALRRGREWRFPAWQFSDDGTIPGLSHVIAAWHGTPLSLSAWARASSPDLDGRTPAREVERPGGLERVLELERALAATGW